MPLDATSFEPFAHSPLYALSLRLAADDDLMIRTIREAAARRNGNASRNTYLRELDAMAQARTLPQRFPDAAHRPLLYGLPIAIKDCFDVAGTITTCGSRYYAAANTPATADSWVAERLLAAGAVLMGKTHLHELAYGITGENPWFGDCLQPRDAVQLTGGSSSGAAASIQEGSAVAAIGTDTGGSIRAPAAFCGLSGFRASLDIGAWRGGWHLAPSFDTIGWLFRDLRDAPLLAAALFGIQPVPHATATLRIGIPHRQFLHDCEPAMLASLEQWRLTLASHGHLLAEFSTDFWQDAYSIFAGIQAHEAAGLHRGHFDAFEPGIGDRLRWGEGLTEPQLAELRSLHTEFLARMDERTATFDFLLMPSTPVEKLLAGEDQSQARPRILRYTTPISLTGCPLIALPRGMQLVGRRKDDAKLLAFAASLSEDGIQEEKPL